MLNKKVLIAGDIMLDSYHFGKVERISPEAPVPVFLETSNQKCVPGGAANVAVNIATIGLDVHICSIIGTDDYGRKLKSLLIERGVNVDNIVQDENRRTTMKLRYIGQNNQQIMRVDDEVTVPIEIDKMTYLFDALEQKMSEYNVILLSDYNKGFLSKEVTNFFINQGRKNKIPVFIDVKDKDINKYQGATLLKPNRIELSEMTGFSVDSKKDAVKAATWLCRKSGSEYVLTTLGADGMILVGNTGLIKEIKSAASEVYDVTGAGDTSFAYFAAEIVRGSDVKKAMEVANQAAGIQVSKVGTSIVYPSEVYEIDRKNNIAQQKLIDYYAKNGLETLEKLRAAGKKIVFTNGCFDILHSGHVSYLQAARSLGDILVVGVNSDESVRRIKGKERPVNSLHDRLQVLEALACVDYVIPFCEDTPADLIEKLVPDVLVKGGDYKPENIVGADVVKRDGGEVLVLPFVEGKSTTAVIERLKNKR